MCYAPNYRYATFDKKEISLMTKAGYTYKNGGIFIGNIKNKENFCHKFNIPESALDFCACGQCYECRIKQCNDWGVKAVLESLYHDKSSFLTLTYADEHLPYAGYINEDGELSSFICVPTLVKKDIQDFMKRLRKRLCKFYRIPQSQLNLRYIAVGEYGENGTKRPHYHILLFGEDFAFDKLPFLLDRREESARKKHPLFQSVLLSSIWNKGHAVFGDVTSNSSHYTAGYTLKTIKGYARKNQNKNCKRLGINETRDLLKEYSTGVDFDKIRLVEPHVKNDKTEDLTFQNNFILFSNKPGIGAQYYEDHKEVIYENDEIILPGNSKFKVVKPPRGFDRRFEIDQPEALDLVKNLRKKKAEAQRTLERQRTSMSDEEIFSARAVATDAKVKAFRKRL